jgi:hypothetical protein
MLTGLIQIRMGTVTMGFSMSEANLETLISQVRARYAKIRKDSSQMESFLLHLRSLGQWEQEESMDYPTVTADFPKTVAIAYAVCHPDCGTKELIVDGSTQECQRCGRLMFRTEIQKYERK